MEKTEYLLLYIVNIITDQAKIFNEEKEKYNEVLSKIASLESIDKIVDEEFLNIKNQKEMMDYLKERHSGIKKIVPASQLEDNDDYSIALYHLLSSFLFQKKE